MSRIKRAFIQCATKNISFYEGVNTIGRRNDAVFILNDINASQMHAIIAIIDENHYVSDMRSSNGTELNDMLLVPYRMYKLNDGDTLVFSPKYKGCYHKLPSDSSQLQSLTQSDSSQLQSNLYMGATQIQSSEFNEHLGADMSNILINTKVNTQGFLKSMHELDTQVNPVQHTSVKVPPNTDWYNLETQVDPIEQHCRQERIPETQESQVQFDVSLSSMEKSSVTVDSQEQSHTVSIKNNDCSPQFVVSLNESDIPMCEQILENPWHSPVLQVAPVTPRTMLSDANGSDSMDMEEQEQQQDEDATQLVDLPAEYSARDVVEEAPPPVETHTEDECSVLSGTHDSEIFDVQLDDRAPNTDAAAAKEQVETSPEIKARNGSQFIISDSDEEITDQDEESSMRRRSLNVDISMEEVPATQIMDKPASEAFKCNDDSLPVNLIARMQHLDNDDFDFIPPSQPTSKPPRRVSIDEDDVFMAPTQPIGGHVESRQIADDTIDYIAPTQKLDNSVRNEIVIDYYAATQPITKEADTVDYLAATQVLKGRIDERKSANPSSQGDFDALPTKDKFTKEDNEEIILKSISTHITHPVTPTTSSVRASTNDFMEKDKENQIPSPMNKSLSAEVRNKDGIAKTAKVVDIESQLEVMFASQNLPCSTMIVAENDSLRPTNPLAHIFDMSSTQEVAGKVTDGTRQLTNSFGEASKKETLKFAKRSCDDTLVLHSIDDSFHPTRDQNEDTSDSSSEEHDSAPLGPPPDAIIKKIQSMASQIRERPIEPIGSKIATRRSTRKATALVETYVEAEVTPPNPKRIKQQAKPAEKTAASSVTKQAPHIKKKRRLLNEEDISMVSIIPTPSPPPVPKRPSVRLDEKVEDKAPRRKLRSATSISHADDANKPSSRPRPLAKNAKSPPDLDLDLSDLRVPRNQLRLVSVPADELPQDATVAVTRPRRVTRTRKTQVLFTMMDDPKLVALIKQLGGSIASSVETASVLVTGSIQRTVKLLSALGRPIPICSPDWLYACKAAGAFLDPWDHLMQDAVAEKKWSFNLRESMERAKEKKLFAGFSFQLLVTVSLDVVKGAILANGGKIVKRFAKGVVIVGAESSRGKWQVFLNQGGVVVSSEAVLVGILRQMIVFDEFSYK